LIPIHDIEKVFEIIDRELAFIELRPMNFNRKKIVMDNWLFIRDTFQKVCHDCAQCEGLIKKDA